jgi:hypothetical protein
MRGWWFALSGWIIFALPAADAATVCTFKGQADFINKDIQLEIAFKEKERIINSFKVVGDTVYLNSQIEHIKINQADLSTNIESSFYIEKDAAGKARNLKGLVWTRYSLLNYKPYKEVAGSFPFKDGWLTIEKLTWAEMDVSGQLNLKPPFDLDLAIEITDMDIDELAPLVGIKTEQLFLSGLVSGRLRLSGRINAMQLNGQLRSKVGQIEDFVYRDANINFTGRYPALDIVDSSISDERGYIYTLVGKFNLNEINDFTSSQHQINVSPFSDAKAWTIRRKEVLGQESEELEFGYRLKPKQPSELLSGDREGMLGIERKHRF